MDNQQQDFSGTCTSCVELDFNGKQWIGFGALHTRSLADVFIRKPDISILFIPIP